MAAAAGPGHAAHLPRGGARGRLRASGDPCADPGAAGPGGAQPGPRLYHGAHKPEFQPLLQRLEGGWVDLLREAVGLSADRLPLLCDGDFLHGDGADRFVLCEVNVSSASPFPPAAIAPPVAAVQALLAR